MNSRKNKILVLLGFWWLFIALLMPIANGTINQKIQGFVIMSILTIIHFLLAKNYIMFYFSKESKNLRKEIKEKEFNQFKTELENKNNQMDLIKCPQCDCLISTNNTFCTTCGKKLKDNNLTANESVFFEDVEDPLYKEILNFVLNQEKISVSLIQRKYRLGYNRATKIIELLEKNNIIGPLDNSNLRRVLISSNNNINKSNFSTIEEDFNDEDFNSVLDTNNNDYLLYKIKYKMTGKDFEVFSKILLENNGFTNITVTKSSNDYGADVIAYKDNIKYAIQCKKYSKPVGVEAIQQVIASKSIYKCHVGVVLTNNTFTKNAQVLAKNNNIILWDEKRLYTFIKNIKQIDNYQELKKIKELLDDGILTQEEFENEKKKILN